MNASVKMKKRAKPKRKVVHSIMLLNSSDTVVSDAYYNNVHMCRVVAIGKVQVKAKTPVC